MRAREAAKVAALEAEYGALVTTAEIAAALSVDPGTVRKWARAGKLASIRTPSGQLRYVAADLRALAGGTYRAPAGSAA